MMKTLLIVDDEKHICLLYEEEFKDEGYNVLTASNGLEALELIEKHREIDLVLLDIKMPEKDGFYVLNTLNEKGLNLKVIVLTAYADVKSAIDSARLGATDFISKPYDLDELIITIRKVLQNENEN